MVTFTDLMIYKTLFFHEKSDQKTSIKNLQLRRKSDYLIDFIFFINMKIP